MARPTIILTRADVARHIALDEVLPAIEACMAAFEDGADLLPPKFIVEVDGGIGACITGYTAATQALTMKLGQERKANASLGLPTIHATINLFDPKTGELLMIVEGVLPTMYRTAAAAAVAVKWLARKDVRNLAVIGAGQLGRECVRAIQLVRRFERIALADVNADHARTVAAELSRELGRPVEALDAQAACRSADVICTATNSTEPIVRSAWVRAGTHLSCMGADLHPKIECEMQLLTRCRLFADQPEHCRSRGEVSQAIEKGVIASDPFLGSLGQVIRGTVPGRTRDDEITLFDGVGMGVQDTTIAHAIYQQASKKGIGTSIALS